MPAGGGMGGLGVEHGVGEAVPEHLRPAVAERTQRGVVAVAAGGGGVVELAGPARRRPRADVPLVDGVGEVVMAVGAVGDHVRRRAGTAGHGRLAGVALEGVGRGELLDVVTDLGGHPGGETDSETGNAQVDLAARDPLPRGCLRGGSGPARGTGTQQQRLHASPPASALRAEALQLADRAADAVGPGRQHRGARDEAVSGQRRGHLVGEPVRLAVMPAPRPRPEGRPDRPGQACVRGPALERGQRGGSAQVVAGELRAAGKVVSTSIRTRLSCRRWAGAARLSSRAMARSSPAASPCGMSGRSAAKRSSPRWQAMRASSRSSFPCAPGHAAAPPDRG